MNVKEGSIELGDPSKVAVDVLQCALGWAPDARLIGNVRAIDIAALAARNILACPMCGAEAWVNIDCQLCCFVSEVLRS